MQKLILLFLWLFLTVLYGVYIFMPELEELQSEEPQAKVAHLTGNPDQVDWKAKDDTFWQQNLGELQYEVCRQGETERAFSGFYNTYKEKGVYHCSACGLALFQSEAKYDSGSGWPSFFQPIAEDRLTLHKDMKIGFERTEIKCARCNSHLGHVFDDGPKPTGKRYCMNSVCLWHQKK